MFGSRADNFRTNETAGRFLSIQTHMAFVDQHNAAAALISEGNLADDKLIRLIFRRNLRVFQADSGNLRTGEYHADYATAQTALNIRENSGIVAGNFALVGSFMQQRQLIGRIACDKDMRNAGLHGQRIGNRHATRIFFDIQVFQTDIVHVRTATGGSQSIFGMEHTFFAILFPMNFNITFCIQFDFGFGIQMQSQLFTKNGFGFFSDNRIGNTANRTGYAKNLNFYAQTVQSLTQL